MIRNFLHSAFSYKPPYTRASQKTDAFIYYDDTEAFESSAYPGEYAFATPFLQMIHLLNVKESYLPTDEIVMYSDSLTAETLATYIADFTTELDLLNDTNARHPEIFSHNIAKWCTELEILRTQMTFSPLTECQETEIIKRLHKIELAYKSLTTVGAGYPHLFSGGTRRMYDIILAEN